MKFYDMTKPNYLTDQEDKRLNPVQIVRGVKLPAVFCNKCAERIGGQWTSSNRIRVTSTMEKKVNEFLIRNKIGKVIHIDKWFEIRKELADILELNEEYITPGSQIGPPKAEVLRGELEDIVHPFPGQIWVKDQVKKALTKHDVSGVNYVKVKIINNLINSNEEFWELDINGKAWRLGRSLETVLDCDKCKRTVFPEPHMLKVNELKWDSSDIFNVDLNPNIVLVTERVCKILDENQFTNYQCIPI